ncbi:MAG: hypothetical protein HUU43_07810 [Ignavibacteriaceae bacterium]|nr:hypothetical protein [Ignavibacteriaceae bacterium]NUM70738.1 hypothetical protein [Ignavibacteriaceae bacterium]
MLRSNPKNEVDTLVLSFWDKGYSTLNRKYGNYLSDPPRIGSYDIEVLARTGEGYAIGIILSEEELVNGPDISKIRFLASRTSRKNGSPVKLFIGVPEDKVQQVRRILKLNLPGLMQNIFIIRLDEQENTLLPEKKRDYRINRYIN